MFKLTDAADLEKAGTSLGAYFSKQVEDLTKTHAHHAAMATQHEALANLHKGEASNCQATHDAMDNGHEQKQHFGKSATFHTSAAGHHDSLAKACASQAEAMKTQIDALKSLSSDWGGTTKAASPFATVGSHALKLTPGANGEVSNVIADMVRETTTHLSKKTLETMDTDPEVQAYMRNTIMKMVGDAIGSTLLPSQVSVVAPNITAVPRNGQPAAQKVNVPLEFQKLVAVDEDDMAAAND